MRHGAVDEEWVRVFDVETVCGEKWEATNMPGFLSRTGAPRCRKCCKRLGIPPGIGAPYNAGIAEPSGC